MTVQLVRLHLQHFYFKNHLLNVSLKRKTNKILHHHTAYDYKKGSTAIGILRQGAGKRQVSRFFFSDNIYKSRSPSDKCRSLRLTKLNLSFSGRQAFRTPTFNDRWPIQTANVIDTYCCNILTARVLSAVVIRRVMMEILSVFLIREAFSKWVVR